MPGKRGGNFSLKVTAVPDEVRESFNLDPFYKKYLDGFGVPIVSSEKVEDEAFFVVRNLMERMLSKRPDVLDVLSREKVRIAIMDIEEVTTDIPEHSDLYEVFPGTDWNTRARGLGATQARPACSVGEENLLGFALYVRQVVAIFEFSIPRNLNFWELKKGGQLKCSTVTNSRPGQYRKLLTEAPMFLSTPWHTAAA